jgi:hypothetical protein
VTAIITTRRALDELPPYTVLVALDDDTDIRVKTSEGDWSVSRRFASEPKGDTHYWAAYTGFKIVHRPA